MEVNQPVGDLPKCHVAILLCSYNGERFIEQQLDSIESQSHTDWKVWVSDDGSSDGTIALLQAYQNRWGANRLEILAGPSRGFSANFLSVTCRPDIQADFFAYCDQDDVWDRDKIERAIRELQSSEAGHPALYCSRTKLVDEDGKHIGFSPLFKKTPGFKNALVQNVGGGNTMVFNRAARKILLAAGPDLQIVAHDWWTYVAVSATGGRVFYDPKPSLLYRQHQRNLIGSNNGKLARLLRLRQLFQGQLRGWIDQNIGGIRRVSPRLSPSSISVLEAFLHSRRGGPFQRVLQLKRSGVFRQTLVDNIGIYAAAFFKKL